MSKPSDKVAKYSFHGSGHIYMDVDMYDEQMRRSAWCVRHALGSNHGFKPESCSGCETIVQFLKENPDGI